MYTATAYMVPNAIAARPRRYMKNSYMFSICQARMSAIVKETMPRAMLTISSSNLILMRDPIPNNILRPNSARATTRTE